MTTEPARRVPPPEGLEPAACAHHWVLAEPTDDSVPGRCKRCGEERRFPGSPEGTRRFDDFQELTSERAYYREASAG